MGLESGPLPIQQMLTETLVVAKASSWDWPGRVCWDLLVFQKSPQEITWGPYRNHMGSGMLLPLTL